MGGLSEDCHDLAENLYLQMNNTLTQLQPSLQVVKHLAFSSQERRSAVVVEWKL